MYQTPYSYLRFNIDEFEAPDYMEEGRDKWDYARGMSVFHEMQRIREANLKIMDMYYLEMMRMWRYGEIYLDQDPAE